MRKSVMMDLIMEINVPCHKMFTTSLNVIWSNFLILFAFSSYLEFLAPSFMSQAQIFFDLCSIAPEIWHGERERIQSG